MNLIWHIIQKDIRRERAGLLAWAVLFVVQVIIGYVLLHLSVGQRLWVDNLQVASGVLVGVQFLLCYALVARLVQTDPLQGTDMFWATRPISSGRLLLAKAGAALLLFGLLPVLLRLPWWVSCGFMARDIFWTAVNTVGWQLVVIAPAFLISSFTSSFPRVLLWSLLLFVAGMMGFGLLARLLVSGAFEGVGAEDYAGINYTRMWLMAALAVLLIGGLMAHHYLTRRFVRSLVMMVGGFALVLSVGWLSSANFSREFASLTRPAYERSDIEAAVAVRAQVGRGFPDPRSDRRQSERDQTLYTEVYFQGLPANMSVTTAGRSWQSWRWADGTKIRRQANSFGGFGEAVSLLRQTYALPEPSQDRETSEWINEKQRQAAADRQARGLNPPLQWITVPPTLPGTRQLVFGRVPASLTKRAMAESPAYEATLDCVLLKPAFAAEVPLRTDARVGFGSVEVYVQHMKPLAAKDGMGVEVSLAFTAPAIQASGLWFVSEILSARDANVLNSLHGGLWSINRVTGDVDSLGRYSLQASRRAVVAGVLISWDTNLRISPRPVIRNGQPQPKDPDWLNHTGLVLVAEKPVARFVAEIKADRLEFLPSRWLETDTTGSASKD